MTKRELDELEKLARAATPGPWANVVHSTQNGTVRNKYTVSTAKGERGAGMIADCEFVMMPLVASRRAQNAAFIAAAHPATVLALIKLARGAA